jgi:hypothetical protein
MTNRPCEKPWCVAIVTPLEPTYNSSSPRCAIHRTDAMEKPSRTTRLAPTENLRVLKNRVHDRWQAKLFHPSVNTASGAEVLLDAIGHFNEVMDEEIERARLADWWS